MLSLVPLTPTIICLACYRNSPTPLIRSFHVVFAFFYHLITSSACFSFKLAVEEINNSSSLLPNTTLITVVNDTHSDRQTALLNAIHQTGRHAVGIIGAFNSDDSEQIALLAGAPHIFTPQISFGSMSATLSNMKLFPAFARTIYSNAIESVRFLRLVFEKEHMQIVEESSFESHG